MQNREASWQEIAVKNGDFSIISVCVAPINEPGPNVQKKPDERIWAKLITTLSRQIRQLIVIAIFIIGVIIIVNIIIPDKSGWC